MSRSPQDRKVFFPPTSPDQSKPRINHVVYAGTTQHTCGTPNYALAELQTINQDLPSDHHPSLDMKLFKLGLH